MDKLTPVLFVEEIEPCLPFWERLGFARTVEVPQDGALGFVVLVKDAVEVMLQSRASIAGDVPALARGPFLATGVGFHLEVADLAQVRGALAGAEVVIPERTAPYGAREIGVRAPGGFVVLFAQHG